MNEHVQVSSCEHCGEPFAPRHRSGGKPQKYCGETCRRDADAKRKASGCHVDDIPKPNAPERGQREAQRESEEGECRDLIPLPKPQPSGPVSDYIKIDHREDFDWRAIEDDIVQNDVPTVAVYENPHGDVCIRRRADWNEDEDVFIVIARSNLPNFIKKLEGLL